MRTSDHDETAKVKGETDGSILHMAAPKYHFTSFVVRSGMTRIGTKMDASRSAAAREIMKTSPPLYFFFFPTIK